MLDYQAQKIDCLVTVISKSDDGSGRSTVPKLNGNWYRPHVVVGDPQQREAKLITHTYEIEKPDGSKVLETSDKWIDEEYLGVSFDTAPDDVDLDHSFRAKLALMYWPNLKYENLTAGATFTIREGGTVVGFGEVIGWLPPEPLNRVEI
jgi:hypothetical protein